MRTVHTVQWSRWCSAFGRPNLGTNQAKTTPAKAGTPAQPLPGGLVSQVLYYAVGTAISDQRMLWDMDGEVKIIKDSPRSMSLPN